MRRAIQCTNDQKRRERLQITDRPELIPETDYTIIQRYQSVLQGLYNFYCMAVNVGNKKRMTYLKWMLER
jgi:hypothetical protein